MTVSHLACRISYKEYQKGLKTNEGTDLITTFQPKTTLRAVEPPVMLCLISYKILKKREAISSLINND
jgi:hypothetical protein